MPYYIRLYRNNEPLMGSDGVMKIDGRLNSSSIRQAIINRNKLVATNFPHIVADAYVICDTCWNSKSKLFYL